MEYLKNILITFAVVTLVLVSLIALQLKTNMDFPLTAQDKQVLKGFINDSLPDLILDNAWNKYFYNFDWADMMVHWAQSITGGGGGAAIALSGSTVGADLVLTTGTTLNGTAEILRGFTLQNILSWGKTQKFRTAFALSGANTNVLGFLVRGNAYQDQYYGFKILNGNLYGVASIYNPTPGGSEQSVLLTPITLDTSYDLMAEFTPGQKVVFSILNTTNNKYDQVGLITKGLPSGTGILESETALADIWVQNTIGGGGTSKDLTLSYFEYIQAR